MGICRLSLFPASTRSRSIWTAGGVLAAIGQKANRRSQLPVESRSSMSTRSRGLPAACFVCLKACIEQTATSTPRISVSTAEARSSAYGGTPSSP